MNDKLLQMLAQAKIRNQQKPSSGMVRSQPVEDMRQDAANLVNNAPVVAERQPMPALPSPKDPREAQRNAIVSGGRVAERQPMAQPSRFRNIFRR